MEILDKFVEFDKYCEKCKYKDCKDVDGKEPCNTCLSYPTQPNSKKPINFKEEEKNKNKE